MSLVLVLAGTISGIVILTIIFLIFREKVLTELKGRKFGLLLFTDDSMVLIKKVRTKQDHIKYDGKLYPIYNYKPTNNIFWQIYCDFFPEPVKVVGDFKNMKSKFTFTNFDLGKFADSKFLEKLSKDKVNMQEMIIIICCIASVGVSLFCLFKLLDISKSLDLALEVIKSVR